MRERTFVNFSNHPSSNWGELQLRAAQEYGRVVDVAFPAVDAEGDEVYIEKLAEKVLEDILEHQPAAVLCQGEFCLVYKVIKMLKERGIIVLSACSKRLVRESGNCKEVVFQFSRFRQY